MWVTSVPKLSITLEHCLFFPQYCAWFSVSLKVSHCNIKFSLAQAMKAQAGIEVYSALSLILALDGCGWSMPLSSRFTPENKSGTHYTRWAAGLVWTCAENLVHTGIQSPDSPAHSESLYQLCYPTLHIA
jgi:hypothetical protein